MVLKPNAKILLATDAREPQTNGVARTWGKVKDDLESHGDKVEIIQPCRLRTYPSLMGLSLAYHPSFAAIDKLFRAFQPDALHILTPESSLGQRVKKYADRNGIRYTSSKAGDVNISREALIPLDNQSFSSKQIANPLVHNSYEFINKQKLDRIRLASFSDVHISTIANDLPKGNHSENFLIDLKAFVSKSERSQNKSRQDLLTLNGDFFDLLESYIWDYGELPVKKEGRLVDPEKVVQLFEKMLGQNQRIISQFTKYLQSSPDAKLIYVIGNHDFLFKLSPTLREMFQRACLPNADEAERKQKIIFTDDLKVEDLGLHIEHGHRLDKYDYSSNGDVCWGDWLAYIKIQVIKNIIKRLEGLKSKYSDNEKQIEKYKNRIMKVEYIRDAKLFPKYLEKLATIAENKYQGSFGNELKAAIMNFNDDFAKMLKKSLGAYGILVPESILKSQSSLELCAKIINFIYKELTHKNSIQTKAAAEICENDPRFICVSMGHTHIHGIHEDVINICGREQRIMSVNSGTYVPMKKVQWKNGVWMIGSTMMPKGGVIFSANLKGNLRKVKVSALHGYETEYKFRVVDTLKVPN